jgi:vancomycin resistance protein YoaR
VGERTVEGGYLDAYIIVDGKFVPGLAGGICQVSSTLYNTGLLANLSVTQRTNHDLAISYVPLGQDATVAYPNLDLKFNNNSGGYLLIRTKTTSDTVTVDIYGKVKPGQEVFITNTTESVIPPEEQHLVDETLAHGVSVLKQQGQQGYIVKSVRTVKVNGKVVSSEPLKQSVYKAMPKIYAVGS